MSKIALNSNASGTGVFTIASPNSDTDRTLTLPDQSGEVITTDASRQSLVLPVGTTAQRPASPEDGYIRFNTTIGAVEIYYATYSSWQTQLVGSIQASGGTETTITESGVDYMVHTFTSSGTFTVTAGGEVEYLVVGGGAGGTGNGEGGAGGGGYRCSVVGESSGRNSPAETKLTVSQGSYTVTIGAGGSAGTNGASTTFASITSLGGGTGGDYYSSTGNGTNNAGASGGCGGGGGGVQSGTAGSGGAGTAGQGFDGGNGATYFSYPPGGGGGGAGQAGSNAVNNVGAGDGGDGIESSIDGNATYRAGGAASYGWSGTGAGLPGLGGAGFISSGVPNTGGGGGRDRPGGSGVVIIRYRI